ncbi:MAG: SOS response-associated peptidase [Fidelibacterota bacterium]
MCFYLSISKDAQTLKNRFRAEFPDEDLFVPQEVFNAFTHPLLPVVTQDEPQTIRLFRWGMIPSWVNDVDFAKRMRRSTLNARSETAGERPSFRNSLRFRRCIVPADAFYEWQHAGRNKIQYRIHCDHDIMGLAGIWDRWVNPVTREQWTGFSILTTAANPLLEVIHNSRKRMPVILPPDKEKAWLSRERKSGPGLQPFLKAYDENRMYAEKT